MSSLQLFNYNSQNVRTVLKDGEPWFVASDVASILGYRNAPDMVRRIDSEDKGYAKVRTLGGEQKLSVLSESGLYDAAFRSNSEGAKPFRRWVTSEVIPSIRRTGSYSVQTAAPALTPLERMAAAVLEAQSIITAKDQEIQELAPKAALAETVVATGDVYTVQVASNLLEDEGFAFTGRNTLFRWLRDHGWVGQYDRSPLQTAITAGYLKRKYYRDAEYLPTTLVTAKGLARIHKMMTEELEAERRAGFRELPAANASLEPKKRKRRPLVAV